ncbi:MAG: hypothetical protein RJA49_2066, partial [Actinomycetota bacterium]
AGNLATTTLTVTVKDTAAPVITLPDNQVLPSNKPTVGVVYTYTATAVDIVSGPVATTCAPASGTTFTFGITTVTCTATDAAGNKATASFTVTVVVQYRYKGFYAPVTMGTYDGYGLNMVVNRVNGGRNVPFKWEIYGNVKDDEQKDALQVEFYFDTYKNFVTKFAGKLPMKAALPAGNPCADVTRTIAPIGAASTSAGNSTALKYDGDDFSIGWKIPAKPALAADNCFVAWTRVKGDAGPGILSLFTIS